MSTEEKFQEGVMRALWERLNQQRWVKSTDDDREYVLQAFQGDVEMPDQSDEEDSGEDEQENSRGNLAPTRDQLTPQVFQKATMRTKITTLRTSYRAQIQQRIVNWPLVINRIGHLLFAATKSVFSNIRQVMA
jgi:predicted Fe-S protein YdhL (DUF1289 family)